MVLALFALTMSSCFVNRTTVGDGPVGKANTVRFSHAKQSYLFWGLVALGQSSPPAPQECGFQVKSSFNLIDCIVTTITGGIFSMRSVKVLVTKDGKCDPAIMKIERKMDKEILKKEEHDK